MVLSIERPQDCTFRFKTKGKFRGYYKTLTLWIINLTWPMGRWGECSLKGYTAAEMYVRQHASVLRILH